MTRYRWILLLPLLGLLVGCAALRLGYPHADTLLAWRADQYFDLEPPQKADLNARLARVLQWHRYEQLPEYVNFLSAAIVKARGGLKREDLTWLVEGFQARYRTVINRTIDDSVELLATLKPEQLTALQKQWEKDNRKFSREHALTGTVQQRKRARVKRTLDQIEDWAGNLSEAQEEKIEALLEAVPHIAQLRQQDRIRRQREFLEILKVRANKQELKHKLQPWLLNWEAGRPPEYERLSNEVYAKRLDFYIAVEKILTPAQRENVLHKLQEYVDDMKALSQRARPS